jgi:hypothetical protein
MRKRIACAVLLWLVVALSGCATGSSNPPSMYPTPAIEQAFNTIYDQRLDAWPIVFDTLREPTALGTTYVIASGPADAPPIVLLHAMGRAPACDGHHRDDVAAQRGGAQQ